MDNSRYSGESCDSKYRGTLPPSAKKIIIQTNSLAPYFALAGSMFSAINEFFEKERIVQ